MHAIASCTITKNIKISKYVDGYVLLALIGPFYRPCHGTSSVGARATNGTNELNIKTFIKSHRTNNDFLFKESSRL